MFSRGVYMFYELHLMIRTENRAHRSRKLLLEIELVFERGGDEQYYFRYFHRVTAFVHGTC